MSHYVYYLFGRGTCELLYIGRSNNPRHRLFAFEKRTGLQVEFGGLLRFTRIEDAQCAEIAAIKKHRPPHNKHLISSLGKLGQPIGRGSKLPAAHKAKISDGLKGREVSSETRAKLSKTLLGHPVSKETRKKIKDKAIERARARRAKSYDFGGFAGGAVITKTDKGSVISQH